jgi:hypothetical protein
MIPSAVDPDRNSAGCSGLSWFELGAEPEKDVHHDCETLGKGRAHHRPPGDREARFSLSFNSPCSAAV